MVTKIQYSPRLSKLLASNPDSEQAKRFRNPEQIENMAVTIMGKIGQKASIVSLTTREAALKQMYEHNMKEAECGITGGAWMDVVPVKVEICEKW